jgi:hypothetical protein
MEPLVFLFFSAALSEAKTQKITELNGIAPALWLNLLTS